MSAPLPISHPLPPRRLCLLLTVDRRSPIFTRFLETLKERSACGDDIYLYCIDEGVREVEMLLPRAGPRLRLFACAYAAMRRSLPRNAAVTYGGLGLLADLILGTGEFLAF
ncbi:hypothetical protein MAMC_00501 [Methylacidimicrobium cyclopophantes]|uniref:Uncharacterized protein n=2 Tax=Methylacidimicrobium cyclopophantes TaxID=1041766 RepID=A0A5E6M7S0_9BACT|nr:hypothetical protein MAMC_00501 [Methylacidimicrobium cyclopophantes]